METGKPLDPDERNFAEALEAEAVAGDAEAAAEGVAPGELERGD